MAEWKTSAYDVSVRNQEDFSQWGWGDVSPEDALACMEVLTGAVQENAMAAISFERGFPEIEAGILSFEYSMAFRLLPLVEKWVEGHSGFDDVLDPAGRPSAQQLLAELEASAAVVRKALVRSNPAEALALD